MYAPIIHSAKTTKKYQFGKYEAAFLEQIIAEGPIGYEFMIVVFEQGATDPFLFVTSERNDPGANAELAKELGLESEELPQQEGESHFLCLFDEGGHRNFGDSNDWGNRAKFESEALRILEHRLGAKPIAI